MNAVAETVVADGSVAKNSKSERLARWSNKVRFDVYLDAVERPQVRVTQMYAHHRYENPSEYVGRVGSLVQVDSSDALRTFRVDFDQAGHDMVWAYDVEPVAEAPADAPVKTPEQQQIADLTVEMQTLHDRYAALNRRFDQFQSQVREVAIRVADEQGWCDDGLNEVLDELGLDPKAPPRKRVVVRFEVTLEGDADHDDASWWHASINDQPSFDGIFDGDVENVDEIEVDYEVVSVDDAD